MSTVYLLHFLQPIAPGRHTAQHYIGSADHLHSRLKKHRADPDARLLQVAKERGIGFVLARTWEGVPRSFEYRLKAQKRAPKLCPICNRPVGQLELFLDFSLADVPELAF